MNPNQEELSSEDGLAKMTSQYCRHDTDLDWNKLQDRLLNEWGGWVNTVYDSTQIHNQIPLSWSQIPNKSCVAFIAELWREARVPLPRFVDYLCQSTQAIFVADGSIGPILVYYLKDWEETEIGQYEDGFMLAGLPMPVERIHAFEQSVGGIPSSLQTLWQIHGFVLIKIGSILSSLDDALEKFCGFPTVWVLEMHPLPPKNNMSV